MAVGGISTQLEKYRRLITGVKIRAIPKEESGDGFSHLGFELRPGSTTKSSL